MNFPSTGRPGNLLFADHLERDVTVVTLSPEDGSAPNAARR
jgi:hypothetical protein